jgi:hypothetical protein
MHADDVSYIEIEEYLRKAQYKCGENLRTMEHMQTHIKQLKSFKTRVIKLEKQRAPQVYSEVRQIAEYIHINDDIAYYNNRQDVQHLHVQEEKLKSNPVPRRSS